MSYKHFCIEIRNCIVYSLKNMKSIRKISKILNCSHRSISREIKRNSRGEVYNPAIAEKLSKERRKNSGSKGKVSESVKEKIKQLRKILPKKLLKSITFDNGKEFLKHRGINLETLIAISRKSA